MPRDRTNLGSATGYRYQARPAAVAPTIFGQPDTVAVSGQCSSGPQAVQRRFSMHSSLLIYSRLSPTHERGVHATCQEYLQKTCTHTCFSFEYVCAYAGARARMHACVWECACRMYRVFACACVRGKCGPSRRPRRPGAMGCRWRRRRSTVGLW